MVAATEQCPWCGTVITHEQFVHIQREIQAQEKRKFAAQEKELRTKLEKEVNAKHAAEQQKLAAERRSLATDRLKLVEERQGLAAVTKQQVDLAKQDAAKRHQKELAEQRAILTKDKDTSLLKKNAEFTREREGWQKKIQDLNRRLEQQKTAGQAGDGAEIDLYEALKDEFGTDQITRIQKGKPGGDVLQEVRYKGESCGTILIDSKNRQAWQASFAKKLRQDQTDAGAAHAILATTVFPAGKKELCIESGVILVSPARATVVVELLRKAMICMHVAELGDSERTTKLTRLYAYMTSTEFTQKLTEAEALTGDALQIDVEEKKAHDNVWKKRGTTITRIKHVLRELDTDISAIIEARDATPIAAMTVRAVVEH
jgi:hypothetical protein